MEREENYEPRLLDPLTAATVGYVAAAGLSSWCRRWRVATTSTAPPSSSSGDEEVVGRGGEEEARGEGKGEGAEGGQGHGRLLPFSRARFPGEEGGEAEEEEEKEEAKEAVESLLASSLVRCRSRPRSTGKCGVFWETNS